MDTRRNPRVCCIACLAHQFTTTCDVASTVIEPINWPITGVSMSTFDVTLIWRMSPDTQTAGSVTRLRSVGRKHFTVTVGVGTATIPFFVCVTMLVGYVAAWTRPATDAHRAPTLDHGACCWALAGDHSFVVATAVLLGPQGQQTSGLDVE